jgi:transposase
MFLEEHPNVHFHFTPTYSSWLNQVEIWFGRIEREVIARGVFSSVRDVARKLMRYIRAYSKTVARSIGSTPMCAAGCQHANEFTATSH